MPCDCKRLTLRYACRHKEQEFYRCWRYNLIRSYFCVGRVLPGCDPVRSTVLIRGVCHDCLDFFAGEFGKKAAIPVSQKFIEYKFNNGLQNQAIDPRTVHRDEYTTSKAALRKLAEDAPEAENARGAGHAKEAEIAAEAKITRGRRSLRVPSTMSVPRVPNNSPVGLRPPPPLVHRNRHQDQHRKRPKAQSVHTDAVPLRRESVRKPVNRNHLPVLNEYSYIISAQDGPFTSEMATCPVKEYGSNTPIDLSDLVSDDFDYPLSARGRPPSGPPVQPKPIRPKTRSHDLPLKRSDCSLVRRITEQAEELDLQSHPDHENESLPSLPTFAKLQRAPKVPTWRKDTPAPAAGIAGEERKIKSVSFAEALNIEHAPRIRTAPATFIRTKPSADSLTVETGTLLDVVSIPPKRVSGVRATDSAAFYYERGIPSTAYMEEKSQDGDNDDHSTMLVSISTPSPAFSCAVQSCFCNPEDSDDKVCLSCLERRRLERAGRVSSQRVMVC
ncbi:hypothetical protein F5Y00DRAFT_239419 [Daldinia vernicosa]|uniref:uncharacterized protein n=1 Tax=Daldinia vernicosa TaxID=114800 RepID=UPI00200864FB|nr:uncharacterized protein F5Y00DRAFT_239419 [Daldinia vernicosa]KAI0848201.1 hypothetical protein F5Y00DRAFT_239419 [Daldinia vernicosa]